MCKIPYVLVFAAIIADSFWMFIDCTSGRGGGGGGGGGSGSCTTIVSFPQFVVRFFLFYLGLIIIYYLCKCVSHVWDDKPRENNFTFVNSKPRENNFTFVNSNSNEQAVYETNTVDNVVEMQSLFDETVFQTGIWISRYYQHGKWHGPHESLLLLDHRTKRIEGWGWDDVGKFAVYGNYSVQTRRIALKKTYQKGTGNKEQNLGRCVLIQLTENTLMDQFEGKWYVHPYEYYGKDRFELKFIRQCEYQEVCAKCDTMDTRMDRCDAHRLTALQKLNLY